MRPLKTAIRFGGVGAVQLGRGPVRPSHEGNRSGLAYGAKPQRTSLSLTKGTRVIVSGRLKSRSYETKEGEKHTVIELEVDEIGASLRYANAKVNRTQRSNGTGQAGGGFGNSNTAATAPQDDPWATPQATSGGRHRATLLNPYGVGASRYAGPEQRWVQRLWCQAVYPVKTGLDRLCGHRCGGCSRQLDGNFQVGASFLLCLCCGRRGCERTNQLHRGRSCSCGAVGGQVVNCVADFLDQLE